MNIRFSGTTVGDLVPAVFSLRFPDPRGTGLKFQERHGMTLTDGSGLVKGQQTTESFRQGFGVHVKGFRSVPDDALMGAERRHDRGFTT